MSVVDFERWRQNFADLIENLVGRRIDYSRMYTAVVSKQNGDGSLQLLVDNEKIRGTGHNNVPLRLGLPGMSAQLLVGARVRVGFEDGDPSKPFAALFDTDAAFVSISFAKGTQAMARQGDLVQSGGPGTTVTFAPLPGSPAIVTSGSPYLISFDVIPPTPILAASLFGSIASGQIKVQG